MTRTGARAPVRLEETSDGRSDGMTMADGTIRAAGCVLWRRGPVDGQLEIALVHRPKYDDWSHPKGKLKRGEDALTGAQREVLEETGMECEPGAVLPTAHYMAGVRPKEVRYWAAEATEGSFEPNREVDRLLWLPPTAARARLTQDRDRPLVDALLRALPADVGGDATYV